MVEGNTAWNMTVTFEKLIHAVLENHHLSSTLGHLPQNTALSMTVIDRLILLGNIYLYQTLYFASV